MKRVRYWAVLALFYWTIAAWDVGQGYYGFATFWAGLGLGSFVFLNDALRRPR